MPDSVESQSLMIELEQRHDEVIHELDLLNIRIEQTMKDWTETRDDSAESAPCN